MDRLHANDGQTLGELCRHLGMTRQDSAVTLTITHEIDRPESKLITAVSGGWPRILSNPKSLIETGEVAITSHPGH